MPITCTIREQINAPAAAVFAAATDFANAPARISGIKKVEVLTPGPVRVGTRFRETRVMFGKEATETMEVIDLQPERSYTLIAASGGFEFRTVISVREVGAGSEMTMAFIGTPRTLVARILGVFMGWMVRTAGAKAIKQDLADLKAAVERDAKGAVVAP